MYTVIIQNNKTYDGLGRYMHLFSDSLDNNDVGICKWNEAGENIDTALPSLKELTDDKENWRAIIVRFEDEESMLKHTCSDINPFDFYDDYISDDIKVSDVPLVRLTQMLGGYPVFNYDLQEKKDKVSEIKGKLQFDGKAPLTITLLSIRRKLKEQDRVNFQIAEPMIKSETESSDFWYRNKYPSICRFLVYDFYNEGAHKREADNIGFWLSVLLLAHNEIEDSAMQAYRLYKISPVINRGALNTLFQQKSEDLRITRKAIKNEILRDLQNNKVPIKEKPKFDVDIPVVLNLSELENKEIAEEHYRLAPDSISSDIQLWTYESEEIENELEEAVIYCERKVDQTAIGMNDYLLLNGIVSEVLSPYEEEDIVKETETLLHNIIVLQSELPSFDVMDNIELVESKKGIKEYLGKRVTRISAIATFAFSAILTAASCIPMIINLITGKSGSVVALIITIAACIGLTAVFALVLLLIQKIRLNKRLRNYNEVISGAYATLTGNTDIYSDYLSTIATHKKGHSLLAASNKTRKEHLEKSAFQYRQIELINEVLEEIKTWSEAFYIDLDFDSDLSEREADFGNQDIQAIRESISFYGDELYPVEINNSGVELQSPFPFIERLEISREELYGNAEHN